MSKHIIFKTESNARKAFIKYLESVGGANSDTWHDMPCDRIFYAGFEAGRNAVLDDIISTAEPKNKPKILVLGQDGHGKTTFANLLAKHHGLVVKDSSWFAMDKAVWPHMKSMYESPYDCFKDRVNKRTIWKALISFYNSPDKAKLCKELLEVADCYVGMRCNLEYEASKHLFDIIYYCDGRKRTGHHEGSLTIPFDKFRMTRIDTNGSENDLEDIVKSLKV